MCKANLSQKEVSVVSKMILMMILTVTMDRRNKETKVYDIVELFIVSSFYRGIGGLYTD